MDLDELLAVQDCVLTRGQALRHLSPAALRHRLRPGGPWQQLLPGVYLTTSGVPTQRQRLRAALLHGGSRAVLGGASAVQQHGLAAPVPDPRVHLLVPHQHRPAPHDLVVVRRTTRPLVPVRRDGLPTAPLPRAVVDACRPLRSERAVRALVAAAVQRRLVPVQALVAELEAGESAGSALVRRVVEEVCDGVRSAPEAELRQLFRMSLVLPAPLWNCRLLHLGSWLADPDAYFEDAGLVVESDSREWHLSPQDWEATLARHARMEATGLHVLHVPPQRHRHSPEVVLAEVEAAYLAARRSGPPPGITVQRVTPVPVAGPRTPW